MVGMLLSSSVASHIHLPVAHWASAVSVFFLFLKKSWCFLEAFAIEAFPASACTVLCGFSFSRRSVLILNDPSPGDPSGSTLE